MLMNSEKSKFDLKNEIIEKLKIKIMNSNCVSFRIFISKVFNGKYTFSFIELYNAFTKIGDFKLYDIINLFGDLNKFNLEPSLKLSLKKLYEYFSLRENKEKLFN